MRVSSPHHKRKLVIIAVAAALVVGFGFWYALSGLQSILSGYTAPVYPGVPSIAAQAVSSRLLFYNSGETLVPYMLVHYDAVNVSYVTVNASMYTVPPPGAVYVLNVSGGLCTHCVNVTSMESYLPGYLSQFGMGANVTKVNITSVSRIPAYSVLILPTGKLPWQLLSSVNGTVPLDSLLRRGTSIIYVGMNFSQVCTQGTCTLLTSPPTAEPYLSSFPAAYNGIGAGMSTFNFAQPTFSFSGGAEFGPLTYVSAYNGSIIAFSNYPDSWPARQEAFDIAKAISEEFWVPSYAHGSTVVRVDGTSSGTVGVVMNATSLFVNQSLATSSYLAGELASSHIRVTLYDNASYGVGSRSAYAYVQYSGTYPLGGSISIPAQVIPGQNVAVEPTLFYTTLTKGSSLNLMISNASDFHTLYYNGLPTFELPPGQQFSYTDRFDLPPGRYIVSLRNITGYTYASALFYVPPLNITAISANFRSNNYTFLMQMANTTLSGLPYTVTFDNCAQCPPYYGVLAPNGTADYTPLGTRTSEIIGKLNFTFSMLGTNFTYTLRNSPSTIVITGPEVELAVVIVIMLVLVIAVKAPNRDEFFIDVPVLPKPETIEVKLRPAEVLSTFDKLNMYYHWQYMPLSIEEVKNAIRMNIRVGNMPVAITYNNAESVLNELHMSGDVVSCDNLYAPKAWVAASGHDIEYLATFKKLRVWFVTHAYMFTEVNASDSADIVVTVKGERALVIIFSGSSKFKSVPLVPNVQTYLAFINSEKMLEFKDALDSAVGDDAELLKMYIAGGRIRLMDADNPVSAFSS